MSKNGDGDGNRSKPELVIGDLFPNAARAVPDRPAVAFGDRALTFAALDSSSNRFARALAARGIGQGSRVAHWSGSDLRATVLFAALAKLGALFIPVSGLLEAAEAAGILEVARPDLVITDTERSSATGAAVMTIAELESLADALPDTAVTRLSGDLQAHVAFFTSGTTGRPKGVVLTHRTSYLRSYPGPLPEPRGAMVCPYPLFHMAAWTIALQQWHARGAVVFAGSGAEEICDAVARHRATRLSGIPAVWQRLLDFAAEQGGSSLESLRFADTGTSATPVELLTAIEELVPGAHVRVLYGSTEAGAVTCLDHADIRRKPGSCGPPVPGVTVRIDDSGELWVKSATLFDGYLDDPGASSAALVGGWYRTGDLATEDGDGFLSIVGRAGDLLRTGGEAVVPAEVESVLAGHPGVAEVAVVGLPDPTWGEVVCAVVVPDPGAPAPTLEGLREHCRGRLAPFKEPRELRLVEGLPRTVSTGQVQRRLLVERFTSGDRPPSG